jgi:hypothetical protein
LANHLSHEQATSPDNDPSAHPAGASALGGGRSVRHEGQSVGRARLGSHSGPLDEPLRRKHLLPSGHALGREAPRARRRLGIRNLGLRFAARARRIDILLTHLHLDHIQGLMFFAPLFMAGGFASAFEYGLDLILDALEKRRDRA